MHLTVRELEPVLALQQRIAHELRIPIEIAQRLELRHCGSDKFITQPQYRDMSFKALNVAPGDLIDMHGRQQLEAAREIDLLLAAREGDTESVRIVCDYAPRRLNETQENDRMTALHLCANYGHTEAVEALINAKADLEANDTVPPEPNSEPIVSQ